MTRFRSTVSQQFQRFLRFPRVIIGLSVITVGGASAAFAVAHSLNHPQALPAPAPSVQPAQAVVTAAPPPKFSKPRRSFNPLRGIATWYGAVLHGHPTASGEIFDETKMTACHNSLPFGTRVRVTDLHSNKSVVVRINDRGVLSQGRVIDLSSAAAEKLGILRTGIASVKIEVLKPAAEIGQPSAD